MFYWKVRVWYTLFWAAPTNELRVECDINVAAKEGGTGTPRDRKVLLLAQQMSEDRRLALRSGGLERASFPVIISLCVRGFPLLHSDERLNIWARKHVSGTDALKRRWSGV